MAFRDLTPWRSPAANRPAGALTPFDTFRVQMDRLFDDFFRGFDAPSFRTDVGGAPMLSPKLDVCATEKGYEISVELPGIDKKDVELTLAEGVLTIKGEKKTERESKEGGHLHVERSYGSFHRSIALPDDADAEKVDAQFQNGVLTISLSRKPEAKPSAHRIEIKNKAS